MLEIGGESPISANCHPENRFTKPVSTEKARQPPFIKDAGAAVACKSRLFTASHRIATKRGNPVHFPSLRAKRGNPVPAKAPYWIAASQAPRVDVVIASKAWQSRSFPVIASEAWQSSALP
ncbi:hypothetical protein, partial [Limnohabitans sp.]|uniref:hypothetical protein n=1 Tax=Limnohabitans sp. TaxID=1907725 RepID=UPI0037BE4131